MDYLRFHHFDDVIMMRMSDVGESEKLQPFPD
jgi:hypothetical protein